MPISVVLLVLGFAAATWFNPLRIMSKLPNGAGTLTVSGTKITMELPRIAGYTRDARAYELSAQSADQDLTRPDSVELKGIAAKVEMQNNSFVEMSAGRGLYNTKAEQLRLGESIVLKSSSGYEARLTDALIDMRNGQIVSEEPVDVKLLNGTFDYTTSGLTTTSAFTSVSINSANVGSTALSVTVAVVASSQTASCRWYSACSSGVSVPRTKPMAPSVSPSTTPMASSCRKTLAQSRSVTCPSAMARASSG